MDGPTEYAIALAGKLDCWVPANRGAETPFTGRTGRRLLYCHNFAKGKHAYIDCDTDMVMTDEEALAELP